MLKLNIKKNSGDIKIGIIKKDNVSFEMIYFDNGVWKEPTRGYSSFGTELIGILSSQLDGDYVRENKSTGTTYKFNLKN